LDADCAWYAACTGYYHRIAANDTSNHRALLERFFEECPRWVIDVAACGVLPEGLLELKLRAACQFSHGFRAAQLVANADTLVYKTTADTQPSPLTSNSRKRSSFASDTDHDQDVNKRRRDASTLSNLDNTDQLTSVITHSPLAMPNSSTTTPYSLTASTPPVSGSLSDGLEAAALTVDVHGGILSTTTTTTSFNGHTLSALTPSEDDTQLNTLLSKELSILQDTSVKRETDQFTQSSDQSQMCS
jgi:hypothetical protein